MFFRLEETSQLRITIVDDGKYLMEVGKGGCRGRNWDKKHCPKDHGRKTLDECATACRKSEFCTAFHILKPSRDQKFDCMLFGHKEIIAVPGLGGVCYKFSDKPPGEEETDDDDIGDEDEEEINEKPLKISKFTRFITFEKMSFLYSWANKICTLGQWKMSRTQMDLQ